MPLYEYQCTACGRRFELIRKFSDPPLEACPTCGGVVTKLISSPAFQFKGSGWYVTDYARKAETSKAGTAAGAESKETAAAKEGKESKEGKDSKEVKDTPAKESVTKEPAISKGESVKE